MYIDEKYLYDIVNFKKVGNLNLTDNLVFNNDNIDLLNMLSENTKPFIDIGILDPPYNTKRKDLQYIDNNQNWDSDFKERVEKIYKLLKPEGFMVVTLNHIKLSEAILISKNIFGEKNISIFTYNTDTGADVKGSHKSLKSVNEFGIIGIKNAKTSNFLAPIKTICIPKIPDHYIHLISFENNENIIKLGSRTLISNSQQEDISFISENFKSIYCDTNSDGGIHIDVKKQLELYFKENSQDFISSDNLSPYLKFLDTPLKITIRETDKKNINEKNKFIIPLNDKFYLINLRLLVPLSDSYFIKGDSLYKQSKLSTYWGDISYNGIKAELPHKLNNSMKPVKLFEQIISLYSSEPNSHVTVFDGYSGRGTIAKAIANLNNNINNIKYNFISCEKNDEIFNDILCPNINSLNNSICSAKFYKIKNLL